MASYLTVDEFKLKTLIPSSYVDTVDAITPGFTAGQLNDWSSWINARLKKRYVTPFSQPYPEQIQIWLARIVTLPVLRKRGVDPTDKQYETVEKDAEDAKKEILEAANGQDGLFDLPATSGASTSGVSKGGPLFYSEQSPYVFMDSQVITGRREDDSGRGSGT